MFSGRIESIAQNMREYGFSLARILQYKDRIVDSVLIRENMVNENPYSRILYAVKRTLVWNYKRITWNEAARWEWRIKHDFSKLVNDFSNCCGINRSFWDKSLLSSWSLGAISCILFLVMHSNKTTPRP